MKKTVTAAELMAQLNADPEFVARRAKQEEVRQMQEAAYREAEKPLVEELRAAGCVVESAWDLIPGDARLDARSSCRQALPILLRHLSKPYPDAILDGIAGALGVVEAKPFWSELIRHYRSQPHSRVKDRLASSIAVVCDDEHIHDVIALARDRTLGPSRLLLLNALERSKDPEARASLMDLQDDPDLRKEIRVILRRLRSKRKR